PALARARWRRALASDADSTEARDRLAQTKPLAWRSDLVVWRERFDDGRPNNSSVAVALGRRLDDGLAMAVGIERQARADAADDERATLELYLDSIPGLSLYLRGGATREADFLPEREADVDAAITVTSGVEALAGVRWRDYSDSDLAIWRPGLRVRPWKSLSVEARYDLVTGLDDDLSAYELRLSLELPRWSPYLAAAFGRDAEPPAPPYDVLTIAAGVVWSPTDEVGLRFDVAREEREDVATSLLVGVGSFIRF
ncbi:MAG: YaiO family outer membrane beta-barrel protein, partial [Planctomycetes bacterium]|nr:YaiO family outer membrane beta-barrel protein [Planctomycetota bacterium]